MAQGNLPVSPDRGTAPMITTPSNSTVSNGSSTKLRQRSTKNTTPPSKVSPPPSPTRLTTSMDDDLYGQISSPRRTRVNSREYTSSYEGSISEANGDMTPIALANNAGSWWNEQQWFIFSAYLIVLGFTYLVIQMILSAIPLEFDATELGGTVTNALHFLVTLIYLHWMKGGTKDDQGNLAHMTVWEQIDGTEGTSRLRLALRLVPSALCWIACHQVGWTRSKEICFFNVVVWYLSILGKMPFMNGVRILGINGNKLD